LEAAEPNVPAHQTITIHSTGTLSHPQLWDTEHPHLYQAVTSILQGGQIVDRYETNFGVRTIKFDPDKGFLLNGKHVPLNGVCLHGDLGCLGIALNRRGMQRQLEIMKEMGCNAIRTSHNPVSPELLDLCDQMGILVMNESFDCWTTGKKLNDYHLLFDDWAERDLRSLIRHAHNHPSIILWSIGNEIRDELRPEGLALARKLTDICHDEDPTRPTTMADIQTQSGFDGMQTGVDVFGYNYHFVSYEKFHAANPAIPLFGSETTSARSSRGEFFLPPALLYADYQVNSYQDGVSRPTNLPEAESQQEAADPYVAGQFVWTGFDYLGEPSPYDNSAAKLPDFTRDDLRQKAAAELKATGKLIYPSRSSYFGIVDLCGFPKDRFYYYQSLWRPDFPMAHIMPHWNWAGHEGQVVPVTVFTSGDEAELFLNGKSLGRRPCAIGSYGIVWNDVVYQPGELSAIAYKNGMGARFREDHERRGANSFASRPLDSAKRRIRPRLYQGHHCRPQQAAGAQGWESHSLRNLGAGRPGWRRQWRCDRPTIFSDSRNRRLQWPGPGRCTHPVRRERSRCTESQFAGPDASRSLAERAIVNPCGRTRVILVP